MWRRSFRNVISKSSLFTTRCYSIFKTSQWLEGLTQEQTLGPIGYTGFFGDLGIRSVIGQIFGL